MLTEAFKNVGEREMTKCMDFINADEAVHVKIGNFWIKYMLDGDPNRYQTVMEKAASLVKATLSSNVEVNRAARRISDFSDYFVDLLEENNHVYGYRKS
ncbi:MAG: ferritin-like domain-containing protein [Microcoleus sp. SU_5_3]|nr:ferritin-like domain-containing protein [Microcoleus sp. SU_5_3]